MTLSHNRHPFTYFTCHQDFVTFWECHWRTFEHFGSVPAGLLYDRTMTVVRRHVGLGPLRLRGALIYSWELGTTYPVFTFFEIPRAEVGTAWRLNECVPTGSAREHG